VPAVLFRMEKRLEEDTSKKFLEVQVAGHGPSTPGDSSVEIRLRNGRSPDGEARIRCRTCAALLVVE